MGKRLFVGNLSFNSTEDGLQAMFDQGGWKTSSISIVTDRDTGRSRGFAFVEMASDQDAAAAMQALDGANFDGRPLRVNEAEEKKPRGGGGGFGGGGGGGGGYGGDRRGGGGGGGGGRRERW
jgi:cold-inducible RNA-binding protein